MIIKNEQKNIEKNTLKTECLEAKPHDYADRNKVYRTWLGRLGWFLQGVSVIASAYLLFDIVDKIAEIGYFNAIFYGVIALCLALFVFVESVRRWLIDTMGYHYMATFYILPNKTIKKGEILRAKLIITLVISAVMITTGVSGIYQLVYNVSPKAKTHDVKTVTKTAVAHIENQTSSVKEADKQIASLQAKINAIINEPSNYNVWKGTRYITQTADANVKEFTAQISQINQAKQKSLDIISKNQDRAHALEDKTEAQNIAITSDNVQNRTQWALIFAGIWLAFEVLLLFAVSFEWQYRYKVRYESMVEALNNGVVKTETVKTPSKPIFNKTASVINNVKNASGRFNVKRARTNNVSAITAEVKTPTTPQSSFPVVGFETGKNVKPVEITEPVNITPTPVTPTRIVVVDKEVRVEKDGFECKCLTCGKVTRTKRPAKFCPDSKDSKGKKVTSPCRNTWHHGFTREQKIARWVEYGFNINDFDKK